MQFRNTLRKAIVLGLFTAVAVPGAAYAVTINFDEIRTGVSGVAALTPDHYAAQGVLFEEITTGGFRTGLNVVREPVFGHGATSNPNAGTYGFQGRVVQATFVDNGGLDGLTDFVSLDVGDLSGEADPISALAFNIDGLFLGSRSFTSQPTNVLGINNFGTLVFSIVGIHSLIIRDASPSGASFDNFRFNPVRSAHPVGPTQVPEPATASLLLTGMLGAACRRRYKK